jgi:hypothetical protein
MIGFTYLFTKSIDTVPAVPDNEASSSSTTSTSEPSDTPAETTLPVVVSPEVQAYAAGLDGFDLSLADLGIRMVTVNAAWDGRTATYSDTKTALETLVVDTTAFADQVAAATPPAGDANLALEHEKIVTAATAAKTAAEKVLDGLVNSEGSADRLAALDAFNASVTNFTDAVAAAKAVAGV